MSKSCQTRKYKIIFAAVLCGIALFSIAFRFIESRLIYKTPYRSIVKSASKDFAVKESIIYAVMKAESGFRVGIVSSKGAVGLMQVLPSTAEFVAEKRGQKFNEESLIYPAVNIEYGAWYLSYLLSKFTEKTAIAAYNAGEGKVRSWLKNPKYSTDGKNLDVIPYRETSAYVRRVYKNISKYNKYHG